MKSRIALCTVALLVAAGLAGCSGGDSASAAGAAEAGQPLRGKAPTKTAQLEGRWVRVGEAEFDSLELMEDGKALVGGADAGLNVDYTVLDGGRLGLTLQGGMTTVYDATVAGDQLELKSSGNLFSEAGTSRYRRLAKGETVAAALQEQARAKAEAYRKRVEALEAFLRQPDLVLAFTETGPGAPASIALEIETAGGGFEGRAWHDDRPPHLNAISGELQLDAAANTAQVIVTYGQRIAPPATQPDGGGRIAMHVAGEGKSLSVRADVTFGGSGPSHELVLRSDAKLHAAIVKRYEAELARIEALKQPLISLLRDYAVLRGEVQSQDTRRTEPDTTELTLARDPASGQYWCEGSFVGARGRGELVTSAAAEIAVEGDRPLLRVVASPVRQYLLSLPERGGAPGDSAPVLTGSWSQPGYGQGHGARFEVVEALDAKARDAMFEARRRALAALPAEAVFTGLASEDSGFGMEMPIAFRLQLGIQADGGVAGRADYPTLATRMTVAGRLAETRFGPRLELGYTAAESTPGDKIFLRSIQGGSWHLVPAEGGGPLRLRGYFTGPPLRPTVLTLVDAASTARLRDDLVELLGGGAALHVAKFVGWQQPGVTPTVLEWRLDADTGALTGRTVVDGRALGSNEKLVTSHAGELVEEDGWLVLKVVQSSPYHAYDRLVAALQLYVAEDASGVLHLNGAVVGQGTVPNDQPLPAFPSAFDRLVELVPVAATDAVTHAAIDQAVADVQAAREAAAAAARAAEQAALEARRAELAPFFPLLRSEHGLVVTSDAPMALGSVLTEVHVDEAQATITGSGVDLREMPFRPFTFECGVDPWRNLTLATSLATTPWAFAAPKDGRVAAGKGVTLTVLAEGERAQLDARIALGERLQSADPLALPVEILDAATAKAREAGQAARALPGVCLYRDRRNDKVGAMFTPQSNGRYLWRSEPITHRLDEPLRGRALYIKNGGPTNDLVVVVNGVHRAVVPVIEKYGAAIVTLPPDLEVLDLRLQADGTAQARGVVLLD